MTSRINVSERVLDITKYARAERPYCLSAVGQRTYVHTYHNILSLRVRSCRAREFKDLRRRFQTL
jgi:hypothetical protein